jgi:hypothetical protein
MEVPEVEFTGDDVPEAGLTFFVMPTSGTWTSGEPARRTWSGRTALAVAQASSSLACKPSRWRCSMGSLSSTTAT